MNKICCRCDKILNKKDFEVSDKQLICERCFNEIKIWLQNMKQQEIDEKCFINLKIYLKKLKQQKIDND